MAEANRTPTDKRALILRWIEEQEALCKAATPGPWYARILGAGRRLTVWVAGPDIPSEGDNSVVAWNGFDSSATSRPSQAKNARLIAASRTGYPLALAALRAEVEAHVRIGIRCRTCSGRYGQWDSCDGIDRLFCSLGLQDSGR